MGVWSEIGYSRVLQFQRLDPDFYKRENENIVNVLFKTNSFHFFNTYIKEITDGKHGGVTYTDSGVIFIRNQNVKNGHIDFSDNKFISERESCESIRAELKAKDIVITTIGANIGDAAIVPEGVMRSTINQNLVRIGIKNIDPYYLALFFLTKYGYKQIIRLSTGNAQPIIVYPNLKKVIIFEPDSTKQADAAKLYKESIKTKQLSQSLYTQAQTLLEHELGLDRLVFSKPQSYEARLAEVVGNKRADADYYQIPFRALEKHLDKIETKPLWQIADLIKGIEVGTGAYTSNGIPFLRVSNIKETGITLGNSDKYITEKLYASLKANQLQLGELLLTKDGTPGVCYGVTEEIKGIVSGGVVRLVLKGDSFPIEYLTLVINSKICRMQIEQDCSGALIVHWKPGSIKKLRIPVLSTLKMIELHKLVTNSKKARIESQHLLAQAKHRVETLIEQAVQK